MTDLLALFEIRRHFASLSAKVVSLVRAVAPQIVGLGVMAFSCAQMLAETVTLTASADTSLFELDPGNNLGGSSDVAAGTIRTGQRSRALFKFELSSLPSNATVSSATLTLKVVRVPSGGGPSSTFNVHRVLQSWGEGTKGGARGSTASPNEASWNQRLTGASSWSAPGAAAGSDYASSASASTSVSGTGSYSFGSSSGIVDDVQAWLNNPSSNFGWILISQSESVSKSARRFGARESGGNAPTLFIQYSVPAATVTISGKTTYYDGAQAVTGVTLSLTGAKTDSATTGGDGTFGFSVNQTGTYAIGPAKSSESPANQGVTTQDIALIRQHILGQAPLNSPYKLLAADVNNSGSLSTHDIVFMRRVIAGTATSYPAGVWKFVRSDFTFVDPSAPWGFDSSRSISNPTSNQPNLDFIGIKLGDVNASWTPP